MAGSAPGRGRGACGRPGAHWVVQKYIERPLLVGGRKFDIRAYALVAPCGRVFMHRSAYARTSSSAFGLSDLADRRAMRLLAWAPPAAAHARHDSARHEHRTVTQSVAVPCQCAHKCPRGRPRASRSKEESDSAK